MSDTALGTAESGLTVFNGLPDGRARAGLLSCCASPAWAEQLLAARPYRTIGELLDRADRAVAGLSDAELDQLMAAEGRA